MDERNHHEGASGDRLRVLVVDDSAYNRQTIASMLAGDPAIEVVGRAVNGKEALQMAFDLRPDAITLDLEMPEMDGFAFLRLLMAKRPTPVIVISSHADRDHVFRALELGAIDFIAKPTRQIGPELRRIEDEVREKLRLVRRLEAVRLQERVRSLAQLEVEAPTATVGAPQPAAREPPPDGEAPLGVVAIAASTGGPPAIQQLLCALPATLPVAIVVAQHMPARFTRAFAGRLDKVSLFHVVEAQDGDPLRRGTVYIAPGAFNVEVEASGGGARLRVREPSPRAGVPALTPSGDLLFATGAAAFGKRFCALVLTGMGTDGREGAEAAHRAGALVLAEDPRTAVMPGMPGAVIDAGVVDQVLVLEELPIAIARFAEACRADVGRT